MFVTINILIGTILYLISIAGSLIIPEIEYLAYISLIYMIIATAYGDHILFTKI